MTFYINAWLDRSDPYVSIHNKETNEVVAHFEGDNLREIVAKDYFCLSDFCDPSVCRQQELVRCLLLAHSKLQLNHHLCGLFEKCRTSKNMQDSPSAVVLPFRERQAE